MQRQAQRHTERQGPLVGRVLDGRYRIGPRIARGGMATVYEATDLRLDRTVAVKVMHEGLADDEEFVRRFQREARSAARLSHPNVVSVFDTGDDDGTLFLVMEYVPGHTLRDLIRKESPMSPAKALALAEPLLRALGAAHDAGLVHRDVKPENVLLADDGRVKVADFGLSRAVNAETQHTATGGVLIGTVSYLSPELVVNGQADARADVYAVGVMLYEMVTGTKPHQADNPIQVAYKHVHEDVPPPSLRARGIPAYVDALVARATSRDTSTRPADARVLLHQVRRVRSALDHGVAEDPELVADLVPTAPVRGERTGELPVGRPLEVLDPADFVEEHVEDHPRPHAHDVTDALVLRQRTPDHERVGGGGDGRGPVPAYDGRRRSRRGPVGLVLLLLLALVAGVAGWYFGIARFTQTPGVLNLPEAAAATKVHDAHLAFRVGGQGYSETVPRGQVLRTDPAPGGRIAKDGTVSAVLSLGPERHVVPDLAGQSADAARTALARARLTAGRTTEQFSDTVPTGQVIGVDPAVGTPLKRGAVVDLAVSKGPQPIDIPSVVGQPAEAAQARLKGLGFKAPTTRDYSDTVARGDVITQDPASGTGKRGDAISLVVSRGPELVSVPGVKGMGLAAATSTLEGAGFRVQVKHSSIYVGLQYVVNSTPGAGDKAPRHSVVTVYIV